jgi:phosphotransferase system  glucose/maltose/N-acetylglucosamine-specific IIC component
MGFGTFVEASYPYMFSDKLVFAGAIIASTVSGALVGLFGVRGTAYVPSLLAPGLANEGHALKMVICMVVAMAVSFVITLIANRIHIRKHKNEDLHTAA